MDFAEDFKRRREAAKLSQDEMADLLGVAKRTVSSWETGENTPQPKKRRKIDEILMKIEGNKVDEDLLTIDRSIIIEALLRNVLRQIAKERAERHGVPESWKEYLHQINEDTLEEMHKIASKLGLPKS